MDLYPHSGTFPSHENHEHYNHQNPLIHLGGRGPGGDTPIYELYRYVPLWRVGFSSSLVWDRVKKSESFGLKKGSICWKTDLCYDEFSLE